MNEEELKKELIKFQKKIFESQESVNPIFEKFYLDNWLDFLA